MSASLGLHLDRCIADSLRRYTRAEFGFGKHRCSGDVTPLVVPLLDEMNRSLVAILSRHQPEAALYVDGRYVGLIFLDQGEFFGRVLDLVDHLMEQPAETDPNEGLTTAANG